MKTNKIHLLLVNWNGIDRTEPNSEERAKQGRYIEAYEGLDVLRYIEDYSYEQGWRLYCFTTKKQVKLLMEICLTQERK